jgi:hypothetical protein
MPEIWVVEISWKQGEWQPTIVVCLLQADAGKERHRMEHQASVLRPGQPYPKYRVKRYERASRRKSGDDEQG